MNNLKVIIERAAGNWAAYIDGVGGIAVTGKTVDETKARMKEAVGLFIATSRELGTEIPPELSGEYSLTFTET